jgi:hypothetical protein
MIRAARQRSTTTSRSSSGSSGVRSPLRSWSPPWSLKNRTTPTSSSRSRQSSESWSPCARTTTSSQPRPSSSQRTTSPTQHLQPLRLQTPRNNLPLQLQAPTGSAPSALRLLPPVPQRARTDHPEAPVGSAAAAISNRRAALLPQVLPQLPEKASEKQRGRRQTKQGGIPAIEGNREGQRRCPSEGSPGREIWLPNFVGRCVLGGAAEGARGHTGHFWEVQPSLSL